MAKKKTKDTRIPVEYTPYRGRILSDENNKYVYRRGSDLLHDKTCSEVKFISDEDLCYSTEYIESMKICSKCCAKVYYRINNDMSNYRQHERLFKRMRLSNEAIKKAYLDYGAISSALGNTLKIHINDDTWKIESISESGRVNLFHNNYKKLPTGDREIDTGYHLQRQETSPINGKWAFNYIEGYSWEDHKIRAIRRMEYRKIREARGIKKMWLKLKQKFSYSPYIGRLRKLISS